MTADVQRFRFPEFLLTLHFDGISFAERLSMPHLEGTSFAARLSLLYLCGRTFGECLLALHLEGVHAATNVALYLEGASCTVRLVAH